MKHPTLFLSLFYLLSIFFCSFASADEADSYADNELVGPLLFVDEDVQQILKLVETLTDKIIISQQNLPTVKFNFEVNKQISKEQALIALESLLAMNGIALAPMGDQFLKAVTTVGINTQIPEMLTGSVQNLPPSQQTYSMHIQLQYLDVMQAEAFIRTFLSPGISALTPFEKSNSFFVTDSLVNLQRLQAVLEDIDVPTTAKEEIKFFSIKNVKVSDLRRELEEMLQSTLKRRLEGNTTFSSSDRTNQLIVNTHPSNLGLLKKIIYSLDKDVDPLTHSQVVYLKHANASDVKSIIEEIINGQKQNEKEAFAKQQDSTAAPNTPPAGPTTPEAVKNAAPDPIADIANSLSPSLQFSEHVNTVADERSNAVVIYGTKMDLKQIERLIEKLDIKLAQVKIETIIAEVTLSKGQTRGLDAFNFDYTSKGGADSTSDFYTFEGVSVGGLALNAINFATPGSQDLEISSILQIAKSKSNIQVLSAPTIVTTHNQEAKINVSQSQPIITGSLTDSTGTSTSSTVQYRDIGIQLTCKPLIGSDGTIQMEIEQLVENQVDEVEIDDNFQPVIGKREAKSFISVGDNEIIVLGGLQETNPISTKGKLFLLGDLPIIGDALFTRKEESNTTRELIIFIKPRIIVSSADIKKNTDETIGSSRQQENINYFLENDKFREPKFEDSLPKKALNLFRRKKDASAEPSKETQNQEQEVGYHDLRVRANEAVGETSNPTQHDSP